MQNPLPRLSFFLFLYVAAVQVSMAQSGIGVTFLDYRLDSTQNVDLGYTLTISAVVRNTDTTQSFSGFLDFGLRNRDTVLSNSSIFNKPPYSGNTLMLNPGETVPAIFSIDIKDPYFAPGPDVVVVWPISNRPVADSILINLLIQGPNGIAKNQEPHFHYRLTHNQIDLIYSAAELNIKQVRILNILGEQVYDIYSEVITQIPIPILPRGMYLCQIISADKKIRVIKFIR
jgi:hypothetical protein